MEVEVRVKALRFYRVILILMDQILKSVRIRIFKYIVVDEEKANEVEAIQK